MIRFLEKKEIGTSGAASNYYRTHSVNVSCVINSTNVFN